MDLRPTALTLAMCALNECLMLLIVLFVNLVLGLFRIRPARRAFALGLVRSCSVLRRGDASLLPVVANDLAPPGGLLVSRHGRRLSQRPPRAEL